MRKIDLFIFDLDGTLIDSKRDIADSVHHTMKMLGLPRIEDEVIYSYVGNGVTPLIQKSVSVGAGFKPAPTFEKALKIFKAHYDQHLLDTTRPFPGIVEILEHFRDKKKIVLTNKPQGFSEKILKGLKMDRYFDEIYGGDTPFPKKPAPDVVFHILKKFGLSLEKSLARKSQMQGAREGTTEAYLSGTPQGGTERATQQMGLYRQAVIVGDSRIDLETGHNAGIVTCGVTWGFRPRKELEEIGCDYLIESPRQLIALFE
jgi:phosphoglycolate phosphatase